MKMMDYNGGDCRWVCVAHTSQMMTPPRLDGVFMALMFQCRLNWRGGDRIFIYRRFCFEP